MNLPSVDEVVKIAAEAGKLILTVYSSDDFLVTQKSDKSPVTKADMLSHEYIVEALLSRWEIPVISEEAPVEYEARKEWQTFWLVDPLDGTKDFIAKNDEFTVNIALIQNEEPILGVVHIPATGVTYYAAKNIGAYMLTEAGAIKITCRNQTKDLVCLESRFHSSEETGAFCQRYNIETIRKFGSSIKLCKISEGLADVYPRYQPTKEWDTAAAHCIIYEAGGKLLDINTYAELKYNKMSLVNNSFIASARSHSFRL